MATLSELKKLNREELNEAAKEAGIESPEEYNTKEELLDAVPVDEVVEVPEEDEAEGTESEEEESNRGVDRYQERKSRGRDSKSVGSKKVKKSRDSADNIGVKPRKKSKK